MQRPLNGTQTLRKISGPFQSNQTGHYSRDSNSSSQKTWWKLY